ncbi:hypothetical protein GCM10023210_27130 [Chryseobacterium ginsengisoli]|uniref:Uncharacterized protein n=1 Tax=Chryseobacterium ginsengisoli TaxID=363853 RepID=A0ABP9MED8_9FLAO
MRKKIVLRLSVLIVFLILLWSCHNEDFAKGETEPQRNNANFFKHSSENAKSGVDYIAILDAYNREKDFLTTMSDQKGMPIWEKMQVVDTETATGLMIPLSHDNETMSSVLFATLDSENSVTGVTNYDNRLLESVVNDQRISKKNRENLFYTFMYMDNKTFGNEKFIGIPEDLFIGDKSDGERSEVWIKDFSPTKPKASESGKIIIVESCVLVLHCTHHGTGACDASSGCTACGHTECSYEIIITGDYDPFPSTPGGCIGCGGGGGGGTPGPQPPKDPCSLNEVFYRLNPQCGGGGWNIDIPIEDPCEKTKSLLQNPEVDDKINALYAQSKLTPPNNGEKAFKSNADGSTTSPIIIGGEHSADLGDMTGYAGYYHNHTPKGVKILSPPDIYKLFQFIANQPAGTPVNASFGGMVATEVCAGGCPDGYEYINFLIRFDGTLTDALAIKNRNYTEEDLKILKDNFEQFEQKIRPKSGYSSQNGNFLSFKGLEELLFNALDDMNIDKNKIILQRIDKYGKVYNVTLNADGKPQETPCPEL